MYSTSPKSKEKDIIQRNRQLFCWKGSIEVSKANERSLLT